MKPGPRRIEHWGLTPCPSQHACSVCAVLWDKPEEARYLRDLYTEGVPTWLLAHTFGVPNQDLRSHAWRHNWHRRRSYNLPDPKVVTFMAALARLRETWHLATASTPDRMLELLVKLT